MTKLIILLFTVIRIRPPDDTINVNEDVGDIQVEVEVTAGTFMHYSFTMEIETIAGSAAGNVLGG